MNALPEGSRYAVYYAPAPQSLWRAFGAGWLGRDEISGEALPPPPGSSPDHPAITQAPRRYGWHATLKAPFAAACAPRELLARVDSIARRLRPLPLGQLVPVSMDGFVALVPARQSPCVEAVAAVCVTELDDLRAPLTPQERERRRPARLDERGLELLALYGYPYVLERFRFHMTLSGPLDTGRSGELVARIAPDIARLNRAEAAMLDRLCVFHEAAPGQPFMRIHDAPFPR